MIISASQSKKVVSTLFTDKDFSISLQREFQALFDSTFSFRHGILVRSQYPFKNWIVHKSPSKSLIFIWKSVDTTFLLCDAEIPKYSREWSTNIDHNSNFELFLRSQLRTIFTFFYLEILSHFQLRIIFRVKRSENNSQLKIWKLYFHVFNFGLWISILELFLHFHIFNSELFSHFSTWNYFQDQKNWK